MKRSFRSVLFLISIVLSTLELTSCHPDNVANATAGDIPAPDKRVEAMINDFDKLTTEYVRVSKKLKKGDVSITVKYIELEKKTREESARLQQVSPKMTPQQAQRLASISARTAAQTRD